MTAGTQFTMQASFALSVRWRMEIMTQGTVHAHLHASFSTEESLLLVPGSILNRGFLLAAEIQMWMSLHLMVS